MFVCICMLVLCKTSVQKSANANAIPLPGWAREFEFGKKKKL